MRACTSIVVALTVGTPAVGQTIITVGAKTLPDVLASKLDASAIPLSAATITAPGTPLPRLASGGTWLEPQVVYTSGVAQIAGVADSDSVFIGGVFGAHSSGTNNTGAYIFGEVSVGVNDRATNPTSTWAAFSKAIRFPNAGVTHGHESTIINLGSTVPLTPNTDLNTSGFTMSYWASCGEPGWASTPCSTALGIINNTAPYQRGIVVHEGALDGTTNEALSLPVDYKLSWYSGGTPRANDRAFVTGGVAVRELAASNGNGGWAAVQVNAGGQADTFGPAADNQMSSGSLSRSWTKTFARRHCFPNGVCMYSGAGDPNGVVAASRGSMYLRDDAVSGPALFSNTDGSTTWAGQQSVEPANIAIGDTSQGYAVIEG